MNNIITANELKTKGVQAIQNITDENPEAIITVRGKSKYVVMPVENFNHFRDLELDAALRETREDLKSGKVVNESVEEHMQWLGNV